MVKIYIDLLQDTVNLARSGLERMGFSSLDMSKKEALFAFLDKQSNDFRRGPRRIAKAADFCCPAEHTEALGRFEHLVKIGGNLKPYLSKNTSRRDFLDALLASWNVYHFHLGRELEKPTLRTPNPASRQWICRTGSLLFCWIDDDTIYFIGVWKHDFHNERILRTLHTNWPDLIADYRMPGVHGDSLSPDEINALRKKRANYCVDIDGSAYGLMGGGMASNGYRVTTIAKGLYLRHQAKQSQKTLTTRLPGALRAAQRRYSIPGFQSVHIEQCSVDGGVLRFVLKGKGYSRGGVLLHHPRSEGTKFRLLLFLKSTISVQEWQRIEKVASLCLQHTGNALPETTTGHSLRSYLNAMLWYFHSGDAWKNMPSQGHPPWNSCRKMFRVWLESGTLDCLLRLLSEQVEL